MADTFEKGNKRDLIYKECVFQQVLRYFDPKEIRVPYN